METTTNVNDQYLVRTRREPNEFNDARRRELCMMSCNEDKRVWDAKRRNYGKCPPEVEASVKANKAVISEVMKHFPLGDFPDCTMTPAEVNFEM